MTQKQLERKVKYWQNILKLDHWDISCQLVGDGDIEGWGRSSVQASYFVSHIKVKDSKFYRIDDQEKEMEFEKTVIHELLHCHSAGMRSKDVKGEVAEEEKMIVLLERAFYDLWAGE